MSELPPGWVRSALGDIASITSGVGFPLEQQGVTSGDIGFFKVGDISRAVLERNGVLRNAQHYVTREVANDLKGRPIVIGATVFAKIGEAIHLNRRAYVAEECLVDNNVMAVKALAGVSDRYMFMFLRTQSFSDLSRATTVPSLRKGDIETLEVPLAPFPEQQRIADKLDAVLTRVDTCRGHLDRVSDILKRFRQSVLSAATSGELTRQWRSMRTESVRSWRDSAKIARLPKEYHRLAKQRFEVVPIEHRTGPLPPTWSVETIGGLYDASVLLDFADGNHGSLYPRKEEFSEPAGSAAGATFLTAKQMGDSWELDLDACPRLSRDKAKQLTKGWARNGDLLLSHNATVGRVALLEGVTEDVLLGTSVTFYRFNPDFIAPRFARIVFSSPFFQEQLQSVMAQTTRDQVPITKQVSLHMLCPPLEEQHEVVRRVDSLLASASQIVSLHRAASQVVERLPRGVLAKAFRGELVSQDPSDEPASALLARIHTARVGAGTSKREKRTRPGTVNT